MDPEERNLDIAYTIPHEKEHLTLHIRHTANAWWKDVTKVYRLIDGFDNQGASVEYACIYADITRRQYKYFLKVHPEFLTYKRAQKFARLEKELERKRSVLGRRMVAGDMRAAGQFLWFDEQPEFDMRYKPAHIQLRRIIGLPAKTPPPKSKEQQLIDMATEVEKTRVMLGHPSDPKHYAACGLCAHLPQPSTV